MPQMWMDVDTALSEVPVNLMPLIDDTDFKTIETGVVYNSAGMDLRWNFVTTAGATTSTAVTPTTAGVYDWTHQGDGMYTIEIPASGGASINNDTEGFGWFSGVATGILPWRGPVIGFRAAAINNALIDGGDNLDVNTVQVGGQTASATTGVDFDDIAAILDDTGTSGVLVSSGTGTGQISLSSGTVTVGTNSDKSGYALRSDGLDLVTTWTVGITGNITGNLSGSVGSVTGNVGGNVVGSVGSVTAGVTVTTNNDKTGYSLTQAFPSNFASLGINVSGHVSRVTLVDTTTTNTDMRGTDSAATAGDAMTLTAGERTTLAAAIEAAIINELDGTAVMQAIADLIADDMTTGDLTVQAIAAAARDAILNRVLSGNHDTAGTTGKVLQDILTDTAEIGAAGAGLTNVQISGTQKTLDDLAGDPGTTLASVESTLVADVLQVQTDVTSILTDTGSTIPTTLTSISNAIASVDGKADDIYIDTQTILTVTAKIDTGLEVDGSGGYQWTTLALENAPSGSGGDANEANQTEILNRLGAMENLNGSGATVSGMIKDTYVRIGTVGAVAGSGAIEYVVTVTKDAGVPVDGAEVWVTSDEAGTNVVAGTLNTNASGICTFMLDAGSYYIWMQASGVNFTNPQAITVS